MQCTTHSVSHKPLWLDVIIICYVLCFICTVCLYIITCDTLINYYLLTYLLTSNLLIVYENIKINN